MNIMFESKEEHHQDERSELQKQKDMLKQLILGTGPVAKYAKQGGGKVKELRQISHFLIDKTLGEGTFGKVKLGIQTLT